MARIKATLKKLLSLAGYSVRRVGAGGLSTTERDAVSRLYRERTCNNIIRRDPGGTCIVFSRDRALQLHALLSSYVEQAINPAPVHVLYRATNEQHQRAYECLMGMFAESNITFVPQESGSSFRTQLIELISGITTRTVFFLVDDIVFIRPVDIGVFADADTSAEVRSLRLGPHLRRSYMLDQDQPLPPFTSCPHTVTEALCWKWEKGELDWRYPLSVDGHLLGTDEILAMAQVADFQSPNSFEANLQNFNPVFLDRRGMCYREAKIINIPCNRVQTDFAHNRSGGTTPEYLLDMWNKGFQMDYRRLRNHIGGAVHEEVAVHLIPRE